MTEPTITRSSYTVQQVQTVSGPVTAEGGVPAHLVTVELGRDLTATFTVPMREALGAARHSLVTPVTLRHSRYPADVVVQVESGEEARVVEVVLPLMRAMLTMELQ
ncbi:hypothetical protein [Deinococcus sp. NW-56]|uniref:hypothetical protein n=1 Tax=Deinococcus sp. NW-56 TaxID=2080419 RepID=UPI000CF520C5|nr:hypothetical protein [Deinococcus sp. NW-56]